MTLHRTGKTAAFTNAGNVNCLHLGEEINANLLTNIHSFGRTAKFADHTFRLARCLRNHSHSGRCPGLLTLTFKISDVPAFTAGSKASWFIQITQLNRFIPVRFDGLHLKYITRPSFHHRDGDNFTCVGVYLRHPDFLAE